MILPGKPLMELAEPCRWNRGPAFLAMPPEQWPIRPPHTQDPIPDIRKPLFCGLTQPNQYSDLPDPSCFTTWQYLIEATHQSLQDTAKCNPARNPSFTQAKVEILLLSRAQSDPDDVQALKSGKELPTNSRLSSLSPQYEHKLNLIRVGGRLRLAAELEPGTMHPIVLDPIHPAIRLIIKDYDTCLLHPGPERVFAEIQRSYWILRGRQAIKRHQWTCTDCRKWRAKPIMPKMADLPPSRVRLTQPPFLSTGMDCFGSLLIKVG